MEKAIKQIERELDHLYVQYDKVKKLYYRSVTSENEHGDSQLVRQMCAITDKITALRNAAGIIKDAMGE